MINKHILHLTLISCITFYGTNLIAMQALEDIVKISEEEFQGASEDLSTKLKQAAGNGFFYLEIPKEVRELVKEAEQYAHEFYKDPALTEAEFEDVSGFHKLGQAQAFFCLRRNWSVYPESVQKLAHSLSGLSTEVLRKLLTIVVPQLSHKRWNEATGGLLDDTGEYSFSFNYYDPTDQDHSQEETVGYPAHCDIGFITLLLINKKGLYAYINNMWQQVSPKPGYFVVNFGKAFELLVNNRSKLVASYHVVEHVTQEKHGSDRISFGLFSSNNFETPIMCATQDGLLATIYPNSKKFSETEVSKTKENLAEIPNFIPDSKE